MKRFILFLTLITLFLSCSSVKNIPKIKRGVLNLEDFNIDKKVIGLVGEWEFYWHKFLDEKNPVLDKNNMTGIFHIPSSWNKYYIEGKKLPREGYAAYRLKILIPDGVKREYSLKFLASGVPMKVFINKKLLVKIGKVGKKRGESEPEIKPFIVNFTSDKKEIEIICQVSNFNYSKGGLLQSINFGSKKKIKSYSEVNRILEICLFANIFLIGLYHFILFLFRKMERSLFYFGIFCFLISARVILTGEKFLIEFYDFRWDIVMRMEYLSFYLAIPVFASFIYSMYKDEFSKLYIYSIWGLSFIFSLIVLFTDTYVYTRTLQSFQILTFATGSYIFFVLKEAIKNKRESSFIFMVGFLLLFLTTLNDIFSANKVINTINMIPFGLFLFIMSQAFTLSIRFSKLFIKTQRLSEHLKATNDALFKFVPYEFLFFLNKKNIVDVKLGDNTLKKMSILFSDIRSFTSISEKLSPEENFKFINSYLKNIVPIIKDHKGFIDKYIGDAIMALFPSTTEEALNASIAMLQSLKEYNNQRKNNGEEEVSIGIGIHTGNLILGTIGEENRMETTVISDSVNLASRMESLTKIYGAKIIISEASIQTIDNPKRYEYRYLDTVKVKGKKNSISIIEILDGLDDDEKRLKVKTRGRFETAALFYKVRRISKAYDLLVQIKAENPKDKAVLLYIDRCKNLLTNGIPDDWEAINNLNSKL